LIAGYSNGPENGTVVILRKILIISAAGGDYEGIHISREKEYLR
jgi:FMN-dependent NADH-azoreductase